MLVPDTLGAARLSSVALFHILRRGLFSLAFFQFLSEIPSIKSTIKVLILESN